MSPEDRETLLHWMECGHSYRHIVELAAKPRPDGLDIKLSASMLSRFHQKNVIADQLEDAIELAREISPQDKDPESALRQLSEAFALRMLSSPDADSDAFHKITRYLVRQRALDLQQKRLAFEMQHKHYDIFKRTVEKLPEINRIVRNKSLTPKQRMREFWIQRFGIETVEMIDKANEKYRREHPEEHNTEPDINEADITPPRTREENQQAVNEALGVKMGPPSERWRASREARSDDETPAETAPRGPSKSESPTTQ